MPETVNFTGKFQSVKALIYLNYPYGHCNDCVAFQSQQHPFSFWFQEVKHIKVCKTCSEDLQE